MNNYQHNKRKERITEELCFHKGMFGEPCSNKPMWKLESQHREKMIDKKIKVCDTHLAWGMRFMGHPAIIDAYVGPNNGDEKHIEKEEVKIPSTREMRPTFSGFVPPIPREEK